MATQIDQAKKSTIGQVFKAYDVRALYPQPLNEQVVLKIGYATGEFLKQKAAEAGDAVKLADTVVVSRDMRHSSPALAEALATGLRGAGCNVIDIGMCDTSFIYFAINHLGAAGGVQVTASHNPKDYNGLKISGPQAKPIGAATGLKDIQKTAEQLGDDLPEPTGKYEEQDLWAEYRKHVLSFHQPPKEGRKPLRVVIDASNGMAGRLVPAVFDNVEGLEIIPLNFEITGEFVHDPNPLVAENMKPTQEAVIAHNADLGACFDGDADRCILCDEKGQIIGCDHLTALLVDHFAKNDKGTTIVYDLRSSKALEEAITAAGAKPKKGRVGHVFMKAALRDSGGVFGGELSGHFYFRDNFYADSGAIVFAAVLSVLGEADKPLSELIAPFKKYPQSGEINYRVEDKDAVLDELEAMYAGEATIDKLDGVTVDNWKNADWWFNVRASNTEPLLRLNAEAKNKKALDRLLSDLQPVLGEPAEGH